MGIRSFRTELPSLRHFYPIFFCLVYLRLVDHIALIQFLFHLKFIRRYEKELYR